MVKLINCSACFSPVLRSRKEIIDLSVAYTLAMGRCKVDGDCYHWWKGRGDTIGIWFKAQYRTDVWGTMLRGLKVRAFDIDRYLDPVRVGNLFDLKFWGSLQYLHDCEAFWDDGALTLEGRNYVSRLWKA